MQIDWTGVLSDAVNGVLVVVVPVLVVWLGRTLGALRSAAEGKLAAITDERVRQAAWQLVTVAEQIWARSGAGYGKAKMDWVLAKAQALAATQGIVIDRAAIEHAVYMMNTTTGGLTYAPSGDGTGTADAGSCADAAGDAGWV